MHFFKFVRTVYFIFHSFPYTDEIRKGDLNKGVEHSCFIVHGLVGRKTSSFQYPCFILFLTSISFLKRIIKNKQTKLPFSDFLFGSNNVNIFVDIIRRSAFLLHMSTKTLRLIYFSSNQLNLTCT